MADAAGPRLTVIGEALIDLVPGAGPGSYQAKPGGSPFNVAIGLARLGHRTTLMARLAHGAFGDLLRGQAAAESVDLSRAPDATEPATLAVVHLDRDARASYSFYLQGTADWQWTDAETARLPRDTAVLHTGSLAAWTPPGNERIHAVAAGLRRSGEALISYDPNIRPALLGQPARARLLIERSVSVAHVVKASREDTDWLYPGASPQQVATHWINLGALLAVITDGPRGAHLLQVGTTPMHRPGREVNVVDTIGAGDAFTSGLLSGLTRRGLHTPERVRQCPPALLADVVDEAILVSALTCERPGADPPFATGRTDRVPATPLTPSDLRFTPAPSSRR